MKFKSFSYKSMGSKLFGSYILLFILFLTWIICYSLVLKNRTKMQRYTNTLINAENDYLTFSNLVNEFILVGYTESNFYKTGGKNFENLIHKNYKSLKNSILQVDSLGKDYDLAQGIIPRIQNENDTLYQAISQVKSLLLSRGFKNFGVEGAMRNYAHELEDLSVIPLASLLQLRRHEKDFLLRGDSIYVAKFNSLLDQIIQQGKGKMDVKSPLLIGYGEKFNELVKLDETLGIKNQSGLYQSIKKNIEDLRVSLASLTALSIQEIESRISFNKFLLITLSLVGIIAFVLFTIINTRLLSKDLAKLSYRVHKFYSSGFKVVAKQEKNRAKIAEVEYIHDKFDELSKTLFAKVDELELAKLQAEKVSNYKSMFLANMSHEIRTPLNGILGMVHVLKQGNLTEEQHQYMDIISFSSDHLLSLVNMVLDYSKIDAGKLELEEISFDLNENFNKTVALYKHTAAEKGLKFNVVNLLPAPYYVVGDATRLHQVVINLVNNAIKFTEKGQIDILIEEVSDGPGIGCVKVKVCDTGMGIPTEKISNILEAFEQSDKSNTRKFGGTGLGLTISNRLLSLMGSRLQIRSTQNVGSEFSFKLKLKRAEKMESEPSLVKDYNICGKPKVLIAEDNIVNQEVIRIMLSQYNLDLTLMDNGEKAVNAAKEVGYNLILMDLQMPVMDGWKACEIISSSPDYASHKTPIVAVTANAFDTDRKEALAKGFSGFIGKPVQPKELRAVLEKFRVLLELEECL